MSNNNFPQKLITNNPYINQSHNINYYTKNQNNNFLSFGEGGVQNTIVTMVRNKNKFPNDKNPYYANKKLNPNTNKIDIYQSMPSNKYINPAQNKLNQSQINKNIITNPINKNINNNININPTQVDQNSTNKVYASINISNANPFNKQQVNNNINHKKIFSQNIDNNLDTQDNKPLISQSQIPKKYQTNKYNNNIINKPETQTQLKQSQNVQGYSFQRYKKPALTGLKNLGDTSYLNAVLQFLCNIRNFASYFLNPKNGDYFTKNIIKYPVSYMVHRLCTHLYPYPLKKVGETYTPDSIMEVLGTFNIVYRDYSRKNPIEFIIFFFSILHKELNSKKNMNYSQNNINSKNYQSDKNKVIQYGSLEFAKNNNSIITNYFTWFNIKRIQCNICSNKIYFLQNFQTFDLNIASVAKHKKTQNLNLLDCMEFNKLNFLKNNFCEKCKSYNKVTVSNKIYTSPNYFIFLLDKNENENINFILEQRINLEKYVESKNNIPTSYELNGIVFFDKKKNKYNAFCVSPIDKNWYLYDDEKVKMINNPNFLNLINNNQRTIYRLCILLYNGIPKN